MAVHPIPIYMGSFDPLYRGDLIDLFLDFDADLLDGDDIASVSLALRDTAGRDVPSVVAYTIAGPRCDLRLSVPSTPGDYTLTAELALDDGQRITHTAGVQVS